jgi:NAD(P)-dependent dehydrogenase (short-subunit alcohol dehydrogenase family)
VTEAQPLSGRVFVLLDNGASVSSADVARALAEAGAAVVTVHGERPPEGRGVLAGDPSDPLDVEAATTMAQELFGPVDALLDLADLPPVAVEAVAEVRRRFPA